MDPFRFLLLFSAFSNCLLQILAENVSFSSNNNSADRNIGVKNGFCESWRFSVETNNAGNWTEVPGGCYGFVKEYMTGDKYLSDSYMAADEAYAYASTIDVTGDRKDAWIFDVDETLLSNLAYFLDHGFGLKNLNTRAFVEWGTLARTPALPASLKLYKELQMLGFQLIILTGRPESIRKVTHQNLLMSGYSSWKRLILRGAEDVNKTAEAFKSNKRKEMEKEGFRFHGSSGDQWSDLLGFPMAKRSFKLPNPMYYVP